MSKSTTIILSAVLLIGAGALVWWKIRPSEAPSASADQTTQAPRPRDSKASRPASKKWLGLTDPALPVHVRLDLARGFDTHLGPAEIDILLDSFTHSPPRHAREHWYVVLNEIFGQMRKKGVAADRLGPALTALIEDPSQSEVARDYAIQHLSQWIAPPSPETPGETSADNITAALQAIAATVDDPSIAHTSIPGTALMALTANSPHIPAELTTPVWKKLDPALTAMLKGETHGSLSTRTTIIQSVALRGSSTHLPLIQQFARDEKADPSLRLSSIAALGIYRSGDDRQYLESIATGTTRYRHAAQSALKKLSK